MLALHESDVKGKIAKEELRTTKDQLQKLKNDLQRMKISRPLLNSLNTTVKKAVLEQVQEKLNNAEQEVLKLRTAVSEKGTTITITNQRTRDFEDSKTKYNKEHSTVLQVKSAVQSLNQCLRSSGRVTIDNIIEQIQPLFDVFLFALGPCLLKRKLSLETFRPVSIIQNTGEIFTKKQNEPVPDRSIACE